MLHFVKKYESLLPIQALKRVLEVVWATTRSYHLQPDGQGTEGISTQSRLSSKFIHLRGNFRLKINSILIAWHVKITLLKSEINRFPSPREDFQVSTSTYKLNQKQPRKTPTIEIG